MLVVIPVIRDPLDRVALKAKPLSQKRHSMVKAHQQSAGQCEQAKYKGVLDCKAW